VIQWVIARCRVLQSAAECCKVSQSVAMCCRVLKFVATITPNTNVAQSGVSIQMIVDIYMYIYVYVHVATSGFEIQVKKTRCDAVLWCVVVCCSALQRGAEWCRILRSVAVCSSSLQSVAVCYSVLQCIAPSSPGRKFK